MNIKEFSTTHQDQDVKEYQVPAESIVYFICERDGEIIYIGSTTNIQTRAQSHQARIEFNGKPIFFITSPPEECLHLERMLVEEIKPKYNLQWVVNYYGNCGRKKGPKNSKRSKDIKSQLINIMSTKGITRRELGTRLKVTRQRIHQILNDKEGLSPKTIERIEKALGVKFK